jgi:HD-GYP domain-containing protein (c-di-GMP phosphodiesterase class II)
MEQDDEQMLTLTAVKRLVDYQSAHAVNTSILAVAHGNRLGLPRKTLAELGVAALFLDIGMTEVAAAIADADRPLSPTERQELERHPLLAAQSFLHCESLTDVALRCMQAALEHHRDYDGSGYPEFDGHPPPSFQARLLRICDVYDALTSPRPFRSQPMAPERALQAMLAESGTAFDPLLLKSFINTVGIYPLGALVELNTGELGTVYRFGLDPAELDRPWIRVFAGPDGERVDQLVDLSETDANGEHVRRIARVVAAEELALEVGDHLALL